MKTGVLSVAALLSFSCASLQAQGVDRTDWPKSFTVGTAEQGTAYFTYGSGWTDLVARRLGMPGTTKVTSGAMENLALVQKGDIAFGMATTGPAAESLAGTNPVAPGIEMDHACAMFPMYQTPFSLTALSTSGITTIADIPAGAIVAFGPAQSTSDIYFPLIMELLDVDYLAVNGGWGDMAVQLQDGLLDVIASAAVVPMPAVSRLEDQTEINIIGFTEEEQKKLMESFPVLPYIIEAGTYFSQADDIRSVAMWNIAVANCKLPDSFVEAVVDIVMSDNERMVGIHKAAASTIPENWDKNTVLPWHPGAAKWFRENADAKIPDEKIFGMK